MSLTVKETGCNSTPIDAGTYTARCVGVVDLGIQHNEYNDKDQEKVALIFELHDERTMVDGVDKPRWLSKQYTASLHEKATLRHDLDAWRGKPFNADELKGFQLLNVLGVACMLTISHVEKKSGGERAKITAVSKPMKGLEIPPLENDTILFDLDAEDADEVIKRLPQWMRGIVEQSITWKARHSVTYEADADDDGELPF